MNIWDLIEALQTAGDHNTDTVLAQTPHNSHTFTIEDVELGIHTGKVVLRLKAVEG